MTYSGHIHWRRFRKVTLTAGSGSWRRRAERMEADSIVSPFFSPSYLGIVVFGLVGGGLVLFVGCFTIVSRFFAIIVSSLQQYKRFADRRCLELDRLPRKKNCQATSSFVVLGFVSGCWSVCFGVWFVGCLLYFFCCFSST